MSEDEIQPTDTKEETLPVKEGSEPIAPAATVELDPNPVVASEAEPSSVEEKKVKGRKTKETPVVPTEVSVNVNTIDVKERFIQEAIAQGLTITRISRSGYFGPAARKRPGENTPFSMVVIEFPWSESLTLVYPEVV